jgi:hypothetical protein
MKTMFGSIYPVCTKQTLPVGTAQNEIQQNGKPLVTDPGSVEWINGKPHQTRWIQATTKKGDPITITKEEFDKIPKAFKFDGSPAAATAKEKFTNMNISYTNLPIFGIAFATVAALYALRLAA